MDFIIWRSPLVNLSPTPAVGEQNVTAHGTTPAADRAGGAQGALRFDGRSYLSLDYIDGKPFVPPFSIAVSFMVEELPYEQQCLVSRGHTEGGTGFNFGYTYGGGNPTFYMGFVPYNPVVVEAPARVKAGEWVF